MLNVEVFYQSCTRVKCGLTYVCMLPVFADGQRVAEEMPAGAPSFLPGARTDRHGHEPGCY